MTNTWVPNTGSVTRWENKNEPNFLKSCQTVVVADFILIVMLFKKPKQFSKYFGYFDNKNCYHEL